MPFGVELPENLGQTTTEESAPQQDLSPEEGKVSTESSQPETAKELLDLDKLERFRFEGREWSPKDLKNAYLMREDYTRKTQELSKARQYVDNFEVDLQTVINDPSRIAEFRAVYPAQYVKLAEQVLSRLGGERSAQQVNSNPNDELSKRFSQIENKLSKIDQWEEQQRQQEVRNIESWLDNQYAVLSKKYDKADPEVVTARAQVISDNGHKVDEKVLEKLFEKHHKEVSERWDKSYKETVKKQLEAGSKSKDIGAGGGTPGGAPRTARTIKEATKLALEDLSR